MADYSFSLTTSEPKQMNKIYTELVKEFKPSKIKAKRL